jgi:hypothetical protein
VNGTVCRVGRHRSWGKENTKLQESYWAEAHAVPSPSGTRIAFASDWGNGTTVDTYVIELPSYDLRARDSGRAPCSPLPLRPRQPQTARDF